MADERKSPPNTEDVARRMGQLPRFGPLSPEVGADIPAQEAAGQQALANSDTLPRVMRPDNAQEVLEQAGVKFGELVEGDDLFRYVELPEGWQKRPTDHSLWTDLVDADGNNVASIFYKAAFYDRDAFLRLES